MAEGGGGTRSRRFPSKGGSGAEGEGGVAALGVQVTGCGGWGGGLWAQCVVGDSLVSVSDCGGGGRSSGGCRGASMGTLRCRGGSPTVPRGHGGMESPHGTLTAWGFCTGCVLPRCLPALALGVICPPETLCPPAQFWVPYGPPLPPHCEPYPTFFQGGAKDSPLSQWEYPMPA